MNIEQYISERELFNEDDLTIVGILWYDQQISKNDKLNLSFDFFNRSPEYGICSELNMVYKELDSELKEKLWIEYLKYLKNGTEEQKKQIKYSLWVDFFEDQDTVNEAWNHIVKNSNDKNILREILPISGPVPFNQKDKIYQKLIKDKENHKAIFESLFGSFFDIYGDINISRARIILSTLKVDKTSDKYIELNKNLKMFNSKNEYWNSIKK